MGYGDNIMRRGNRWFYRCRMPSRLAPLVGRAKLVYALRTEDRNVARLLAADLRLRLATYWSRIEILARETPPHVVAELMRRWFKSELEAAYRRYSDGSEFRNVMRDPDGPSAGREASVLLAMDAEHMIETLADEHARRDYWRGHEMAHQMLASFGLPCDRHTQEFQTLAQHVVRGLSLIHEARLQWANGKMGYAPKLPDPSDDLFPAPRTRMQRRRAEDKADSAAGKAPEPKVKPKPAMVDDLIIAWARENTADPKAIYERQRIGARLCRMVGKDDAALITADDVIRWKGDRLAMLSKRTGKPISPVTVIQEINLMSAIWNWSKANRLLEFDANPFSGIAPKVSKRGKQPVRPYTTEEAARVLAFARTCRKPMQRWLPWVLGYTGARLGEVLYSRKQDVRAVQSPVRSDDPIMVLDISPDRERFPKTAWSVRMIPLHPDLIAEGFLDYVAELPEGSVLFPSVKPDKFGNLAGTGTKTFGNWIRGKVGITDPRINPAHSFRHLFEDRMLHARPTPDEANALGGHETGGDTARGGYGNGLRGMPWLTFAIIDRMPSILPSDQKGGAQ